MHKVYESIKAIRVAKGLKQEDVANKLGMAQSNYGRLEKGLTQISIERLEQIAEVFEMSITAIISYESDQQPTNEDISYYIDLCKKYEKTIDTQKKRIAELEEETVNDWSKANDDLKAARARNKDLNDRLKDKERTIQLLEKALNAVTEARNK